jgi:hypothetical protein
MSNKEKKTYQRIKQRLSTSDHQETTASRQYTELYVQLTEADMPGTLNTLNMLLDAVVLCGERPKEDKSCGGTMLSITEHQGRMQAARESARKELLELHQLAEKREAHILARMNEQLLQQHQRIQDLKRENRQLRVDLLALQQGSRSDLL